MSDNNLEKKNLAIIKIRENKIDEAVSILSEIKDPKSYLNAAIILEKMNKIDLAIPQSITNPLMIKFDSIDNILIVNTFSPKN